MPSNDGSSPAGRDVTDWLRILGQQRRFWRPTIKLLLGRTNFSSVITGLIFYFFLSTAVTKKFTFRNIFLPLLILIGMEVATDISDSYIIDVIKKNMDPLDIALSLSMATAMVTVEVYLWLHVIAFYTDD